MEELIERLRALVEDADYADSLQEVSRYCRGMHDLLLAMEERVATLRAETRPVRMGQNDAGKTMVDVLWEGV